MKITFIVLILVACVSGLTVNKDRSPESKASQDLKDLSDLSKEVAEIYRGFIGELSDITPYGEEEVANNSGCACVGLNCGCCAHIEFDKIHLNDTVCANFSYLPAPEYGISFTVSIDNKTWINRTVSVRNPPAICFGVPYLKKFASLCLRFKNLTVTNNTLSGCVDIEAKLEGIIVEKMELGCFKIPPGEKNHRRMVPGLKRNKYLYFKSLKPQKNNKNADQWGLMKKWPIGY